MKLFYTRSNNNNNQIFRSSLFLLLSTLLAAPKDMQKREEDIGLPRFKTKCFIYGWVRNATFGMMEVAWLRVHKGQRTQNLRLPNQFLPNSSYTVVLPLCGNGGCSINETPLWSEMLFSTAHTCRRGTNSQLSVRCHFCAATSTREKRTWLRRKPTSEWLFKKMLSKNNITSTFFTVPNKPTIK